MGGLADGNFHFGCRVSLLWRDSLMNNTVALTHDVACEQGTTTAKLTTRFTFTSQIIAYANIVPRPNR